MKSGAPPVCVDRDRESLELDGASRQRRLEEATAVVGRLAHDFGNILTGILGFTELMLGQVEADSPLSPYLTEVHHAAQQGSRFVHQLRLFSRRTPAQARPALLGPAVAQEEKRLRSAWKLPGMLQTTVPEDLPPVAIDAEPLRHVLGQLLDNACEALLDGTGSVVLSAQLTTVNEADCREMVGNPAPGTHVEVRITDNGCGLSADVQQRLFNEPFFSTKPRHKGYGLATVYGILHTYRGGLTLQPGPDGGVVARLFLPVTAADAGGAASRVETLAFV